MRYFNVSHAYKHALQELLLWGERCAPRGLGIREIRNWCGIIANPSSDAIFTKDPERNDVMEKYLEKEFALYNGGATDAESFGHASSYWRRIANPDGTVNSAYGHLIWHKKSCGNPRFNSEMLTPWEWCVRCLNDDPDTRQAFLRFSLPEHQWPGNKDVTCTMHGQFQVRNGELHFTIVMRSNDIVRGFAYDVPWFCSLMPKMQKELHYLTKLGTYTHFAHSLHLYETDVKLAERMLHGPRGTSKAAG